jgi:hypothetical protein
MAVQYETEDFVSIGYFIDQTGIYLLYNYSTQLYSESSAYLKTVHIFSEQYSDEKMIDVGGVKFLSTIEIQSIPEYMLYITLNRTMSDISAN